MCKFSNHFLDDRIKKPSGFSHLYPNELLFGNCCYKQLRPQIQMQGPEDFRGNYKDFRETSRRIVLGDPHVVLLVATLLEPFQMNPQI